MIAGIEGVVRSHVRSGDLKIGNQQRGREEREVDGEAAAVRRAQHDDGFDALVPPNVLTRVDAPLAEAHHVESLNPKPLDEVADHPDQLGAVVLDESLGRQIDGVRRHVAGRQRVGPGSPRAHVSRALPPSMQQQHRSAGQTWQVPGLEGHPVDLKRQRDRGVEHEGDPIRPRYGCLSARCRRRLIRAGIIGELQVDGPDGELEVLPVGSEVTVKRPQGPLVRLARVENNLDAHSILAQDAARVESRDPGADRKQHASRQPASPDCPISIHEEPRAVNRAHVACGLDGSGYDALRLDHVERSVKRAGVVVRDENTLIGVSGGDSGVAAHL